MVKFCGRLSCTASTPVFLTCGYYQVVFLADFTLVTRSLNPHDTVSNRSESIQRNSNSYFYKYSPLPGFEPQILPRPALQANALPIELSRLDENLRTLVVACAKLVFLSVLIRESNKFSFLYMS